MRKLWLLGMGIVLMGCPCGCAETAETWAWAAVWNIIAATLESLGSVGGA